MNDIIDKIPPATIITIPQVPPVSPVSPLPPLIPPPPKKLFCILEQGKFVNDPLTLKHKTQFTTAFSDFYRLNWLTDKDPNAQIHYKNITWSEGRSLLYQYVPKKYKYYIFIDDDIDFSTKLNTGNVALTIKKLLETYWPICGTFYSKFDPRARGYKKARGISVRGIRDFDLQCQIMEEHFANIIFPVIYHGSQRSLTYANFICHKVFPRKQMIFLDVIIRNTRHIPHADMKLRQFTKFDDIINKFNRHIRDKSFKGKWITNWRTLNVGMLGAKIDRREFIFGLAHLAKIYNVKNVDFVNRKPRA